MHTLRALASRSLLPLVALAALLAGPRAAHAAFQDADGDGLDDNWELLHFGNLTSQDQFGDPDADGMNNLQEYSAGTDPLHYDGPDAPAPVSPSCGSEISSLGTVLTATNAVDPRGTPLLYEYQLFSDPGLTVLVAETQNPTQLIPEGAGTTSWPVPVNLLENDRYYWRVRARDPFTFGPWSAPGCSFFVNTFDEPPTIPRIDSPAYGAHVNIATPILKVNNSTDPDFDTLHYQFSVYSDPALSNQVVATQAAGVAEGAAGTTQWQIPAAANLQEDHFYYWHVRACDSDSVCGAYTVASQFFVSTTNTPPDPPVLAWPQEGATVDELRPQLAIIDSNDTDLDPLVYDWDLAADAGFASIIDGGLHMPSGVQTTTFTVAADLQEDHRYCWRVRADDGQAQSSYRTACFVVSQHDDPPTVPIVLSPSSSIDATSTRPIFYWASSLDPEGDDITYDLELKDDTGAVVGEISGANSTVSAFSTELVDHASYTWRVRAVDDGGAMSAFSADEPFTVKATPDAPPVQTCCQTDAGCQVAHDGGPGAGTGLGIAFGLLACARRRRRRLRAGRHAGH